jgi:hypothetical protein
MMRARAFTGAGLATLATSALLATSASAYLVRPESSFTPAGVTGPVSVAVEQSTGDVYVGGLESSNVERFTATGRPDPSFVSPTLESPRGVAVDNSSGPSKGDVYVAEYGGEKIVKLDSSGKEVAGFTPITGAAIPAGDVGSPGFLPFGVAVDPENGDVVASDGVGGGREVDIFSSSGTFISQFAAPGVRGVAVGAHGEIFTAGGKGAQAWSASDGYSAPTAIVPGFHVGVAVDRATGDVLFDDLETIVEYSEAPGPVWSPLLEFGFGLVGESSWGVAVDEATDTAYVTDEAGPVVVFGSPLMLARAITGTPAAAVSQTSATLAGTVEPEGAQVIACSFEYGLSTSYAGPGSGSGPCSTPSPFSGNTAIPQTNMLKDLQPNQTYHYRLAAVTAGGNSYGEDQTFTTEPAAPAIDNESVSALTQATATLNAGVNPNNQTTTYRFEYGAGSAYTQVLPATEGEVGSGYGNVVLGSELSGLSPGTTYHYRVVATNATGSDPGPDRTFTTPSLQPPLVSTEAAQNVSQDTATLVGSVETQGFQSTYELDLGADTSYGSRIFGDAGVQTGTQTFTVSVQGLQPNTTYHYRILATNAFGTTYGADRTFTTTGFPTAALSAPPATVLVPAPPALTPLAVTVKPKPKAKKKTKKKTKKKSSHGKSSHGKGRK